MKEIIAPDGKIYDIDNTEGRELENNEIEVIQYLRPDGKRRRMIGSLNDMEAIKFSKEMILSIEELNTGTIAFYARFKDEPEEQEFLTVSVNGPGLREKIIDCIKQKYNQRYRKENRI